MKRFQKEISMAGLPEALKDLSADQRARFVMDMFHRIAVHHGLWFSENIHQLGLKKALENLFTARDRSLSIQMERLSKVLGFELQNGVPKALLELSDEGLAELIKAIGVNWLANDGVWFQAVEFSSGMFDAKRANDTCWTRFSPFEAESIRRFLNLPENCGLEGLKAALKFRMYAFINQQSMEDDGPTSFIFRMNDCRVQSARKRKGLDDYPCKSGGMAEYPSFAAFIDPRIITECVGCPPDPHPDNWFCAWRFSLNP